MPSNLMAFLFTFLATLREKISVILKSVYQ